MKFTLIVLLAISGNTLHTIELETFPDKASCSTERDKRITDLALRTVGPGALYECREAKE